MQSILTYEAWLDAVCNICNNLLKANVSVVGNEFKVVASKYRWVVFISCAPLESAYGRGWEPSWGASELMRKIIREWDKLIVEDN